MVRDFKHGAYLARQHEHNMKQSHWESGLLYTLRLPHGDSKVVLGWLNICPVVLIHQSVIYAASDSFIPARSDCPRCPFPFVNGMNEPGRSVSIGIAQEIGNFDCPASITAEENNSTPKRYPSLKCIKPVTFAPIVRASPCQSQAAQHAQFHDDTNILYKDSTLPQHHYFRRCLGLGLSIHSSNSLPQLVYCHEDLDPNPSCWAKEGQRNVCGISPFSPFLCLAGKSDSICDQYSLSSDRDSETEWCQEYFNPSKIEGKGPRMPWKGHTRIVESSVDPATYMAARRILEKKPLSRGYLPDSSIDLTAVKVRFAKEVAVKIYDDNRNKPLKRKSGRIRQLCCFCCTPKQMEVKASNSILTQQDSKTYTDLPENVITFMKPLREKAD